MAGLHFPITADHSSFMRVIHEVTAGVQDASRQIEMNGGSIDRVISNIKGGLATLGIGLGLKELSGQIFNTRAQFEQLEIAFTTMLGSAEKANSLLDQLKQTAAKTPFEMEDVVGGAKSLLAYGIEADKVNDTLIRLGDIAAGLSIPLKDLTWLYGTTMVQGRMFTQDFRQFQGRGIPIADELSKILGVAKEKVGEAVTAGKVGAKELEAAIQSMTNEGGRFGGLMAKQSDSLKGKWENIKDTIQLMFNEMGNETSGVFNLTLDATAAIVDHWQEVITVLGGVAAAYGAQKAYLTLDTAFTAAKNDYGYATEINQLQALLPVKEQAAKTDLEQAVASGKLTEAKAAQIMALREEAEEYVKTLALKEAEAKQAEITAQANLTNAMQEKQIADDWVESAREKWEAAYDTGDAIAEEAASVELETAKTIQSEAADGLAAATKEAKAASSAHVAAHQATESAATQVNTAHTAGNTAATGILTIAKEKLAIAIGKVNAVMKANKISIIIGLIIALGYAIKKLIDYKDEDAQMSAKVDEANEKVTKSVDAEKTKLDELRERLESAKKGSAEWKSARDAIVNQYGQYDAKLAAEIDRVGTLTTSYERLVVAIRKKIAAEGLKEFHDENDHSVDREKDFAEWYNNNFKGKLGANTEKVLRPMIEEFAKNANSGSDFNSFINSKFIERFGREKGEQLYSMTAPALSKIDRREIMRMNREARTERNGLNAYMEANNIDKATADEILLGIKAPEENETKDKSYWENKKKDAESRLAALDSIAAKGKEGAKIKEEIRKYDAEIEAGYSTKTKKSSGATAEQVESKRTASHQKLLDMLKQQSEERLRQEQEYEYERWQNRIDLMEEGEDKVLAQMHLDQSKERTALKEQQNQAIKEEIARQKAIFDATEDKNAAGNKKYAKKVFNAGDGDIINTISELESLEKEIANAEKELDAIYTGPEIDTSAIERGEKKLEELKGKKNTLTVSLGDIDPKEIKKITERFDNLNADLTQKQKKADNDRLEATKEAMNNYLKEYGNYQQKRKAIEDEYQKKIDEAPTRGDRLIAIAQKQKAEADLDFQEWQEKGGMSLAFGDLQNLSKDVIDKLISDMEKYRSKVIATFDPEKIKTYEDALNNLRNARVDIDFEDLDISADLREAISLSKQYADKQFQIAEMKNQREDIQKQIATLSIPLANGQPISEATQNAIDELIVKFNSVDNSIRTSENDAENLEKRLKSAGRLKFSNFDEIADGVQNVAGKASKLASIFDDDVAEAIGDGAEKFGEMYEAVKEITTGFKTLVKTTANTVTTVVTASSEAMKASATTAAGSLQTIEKASAILAIIGAAIQLATIVASLFDSDKKHQKNIEALQDRIDALNLSYDRLKRTTDTLYSKEREESLRNQLELLRQERVAVAQQKIEEEAKRKSDEEAIKGYTERLQELDFEMEDLKAEAEDAIFGDDIKSQIEAFADSYADAWEGNEDRAMSARDTVTEMMKNMVKESIKAAVQGSAAMEHIRDSLTEFYRDGVLDQAEQDYVYGLADRLQKDLDAQFGWADPLMSGDKFSQEASSRGFSGMSQDTGEELNGRFTALQESNERISQTVIGMAADSSSISANVTAIINLSQDLVNIHILNREYLEEIAKNSKNLAGMKEILSNIERKVRNL